MDEKELREKTKAFEEACENLTRHLEKVKENIPQGAGYAFLTINETAVIGKNMGKATGCVNYFNLSYNERMLFMLGMFKELPKPLQEFALKLMQNDDVIVCTDEPDDSENRPAGVTLQ